MRSRKLIAAVAGGAVAIVALSMLGPGRARPVVAAQIWGGPFASALGQASFRVVLVERARGVERRLSGRAISVMATTASGGQARWEGKTGPDGTAEATLTWEDEASGPIRVQVRDDEDHLLVEGRLPEMPEGWGPGESWRAEIQGASSGELEIRVAARRGVLASPFRDEVVVEVRQDGLPAALAHVKVSAVGALVDTAETTRASSATVLTTNGKGRVLLGITPQSHDAELVIEASLRDASGRFEGRLPILPGAIWLDPAASDGSARRLVSPVPREVAYVSIATDRRRLFGAAVPLAVDGQGYAVGALDLTPVLPALRAEASAFLTVASSLEFDGAGTVGWPLTAPVDPFVSVSHPLADVRLLDGMPRAEAFELGRRRIAAWFSSIVLAVAAALEAILLLRAARSGQASIASDGDEAALGLRTVGGTRSLVIAITLALLAFAAVGIVAIWQSTG